LPVDALGVIFRLATVGFCILVFGRVGFFSYDTLRFVESVEKRPPFWDQRILFLARALLILLEGKENDRNEESEFDQKVRLGIETTLLSVRIH
jgi:hypothetical protein